MYVVDLGSLGGFVSSLVNLSAGALRLDGDAFIAVVEERGGALAAWIIALAAGLSYMAGQSVVLLANRVSRRRFVVSLAMGAVALVADIGLWAVSAWIAAIVLVSTPAHLLDVLALVWLSHAPLLLGFLVLLPYLGNAVDKALRLWCLLAMMVAVHAVYGTGFWTSLICAGIGWVVVQFVFRFGKILPFGASRMPHLTEPLLERIVTPEQANAAGGGAETIEPRN
jgi:hypothetical protein